MASTGHDTIAGWFAGRLPDGWFTGAPSVTVDDKQILVVGTLPNRIWIAREAEHRFELPVTWGATSGGTTQTFTPGGSGRRQKGEGEGDAKQVVIDARRRMMRHWRRHFAFGGPRAWGRGDWQPPSSDVQSF